MSNLRVIKGGEYTWKNIEIDKNVTISNRRNNKGSLEYGEVEAKIQDGNVTTKRNGDNKEKTLSFNRLSLNEQKYSVFMSICGLDGNSSNFTQADAVLATELNKEKLNELGIVKIVKDFTKGFVQIILGNGANDVLTFDFETQKEKYNRLGTYTIQKNTNAFDLGIKMGIDPKDLLEANPEYQTPNTEALKNYDASGDAVYITYKAVEFEAGTKLEIPLNYKDCWNNNYNK